LRQQCANTGFRAWKTLPPVPALKAKNPKTLQVKGTKPYIHNPKMLLATVAIAEITNLLYRGKAPDHSHAIAEITNLLYIEAKLLATVNRRDHEPSL